MSKIMSVRPPEEIRKKLRAYAKKKGYTVNHLVTQILWEWEKQQNRVKTRKEK